MNKEDLIETVYDTSIVDVFTHPTFDPEKISGCTSAQRTDLSLIRDSLLFVNTLWTEFVASLDEEEELYYGDCD